MGPNEKKLITKKMADIMIPIDGHPIDGVHALLNSDLVEVAKKAMEEVSVELYAVRMKPGNLHKTDEEIAAEILGMRRHSGIGEPKWL